MTTPTDLTALKARWGDPTDLHWYNGNGAPCSAYNSLADEASATIAALVAEVELLRIKVAIGTYMAGELQRLAGRTPEVRTDDDA